MEASNFVVIVEHDLGYCIVYNYLPFSRMNKQIVVCSLIKKESLIIDDKVLCGHAITVKRLKLIINDKLSLVVVAL